uniref:Uncharacterized protein n=1 Tax=Ostreococcus mediterraneus TaxID=1486918 RepID=A0A7S1EM15_9CHLO|mmetsp:Transcript_6675/g.14751  ORF Transcript_6675/g.14751 Transcript_6675/m.14751 type:complete len:136 (+) Transcript_6675:372-779(+)
MRQTPTTTTTAAIAALSCNDETCSLAAEDVKAFITGKVANNLFENHEEGSSAYQHAERTQCEDEGEDRAIVELSSGTEATNRTSIREKRFCSSCKRNRDAMTYFLENRKTCVTCLTKHKLYIYEKRRRMRYPAND